jgi:hypothetical protein
MTKLEATYPTKEHQTAANAFVEFFTSNYKLDALLLVNSCKLCLSLARPIRLPTTNGFMNRSWRFWVCPSYMSD